MDNFKGGKEQVTRVCARHLIDNRNWYSKQAAFFYECDGLGHPLSLCHSVCESYCDTCYCLQCTVRNINQKSTITVCIPERYREDVKSADAFIYNGTVKTASGNNANCLTFIAMDCSTVFAGNCPGALCNENGHFCTYCGLDAVACDGKNCIELLENQQFCSKCGKPDYQSVE